MSSRLISRSADLRRLRNEGFDLGTRAGYLLVDHVPYVTPDKVVAYGTLVTTLELADDVTVRPDRHEAHFAGETPCDVEGTPLTQVINQSATQELAPGLTVDHYFSSKPTGGYRDYWHKVTSYVAILGTPAQAIDPDATARTFPLNVDDDEDDSPFAYTDTASSRAEIGLVAEKLRTGPVAIIGLGGSGGYVLDLVAKTPVAEIHLYDDDRFSQHNAFRAPGAASGEELAAEPQKVDYFKARYEVLHRRIVAHDRRVDESNVSELDGMSFVFIALDENTAKKPIIERLLAAGVPFVDVGMGIEERDGSLRGLVRITAAAPAKNDHLAGRISLEDAAGKDDYDQNVQVADLNALNATLAVIKWKKMLGFYSDSEGEHFSVYVLDENRLLNEDR
jgi:hypothetical protein